MRVELVSSKGHQGDIWVYASKPIMIEVKKYVNTVPKHEVEKFEKDVAHTEVASGIMVSFSPISGTKQVDVKTLGDKLLVFMTISPNLPLIMLPYIVLLVDKLSKCSAQTVSQERDHVVQHVDQFIQDASQVQQEVKMMMQVIGETQKQVNRLLESLYSSKAKIEMAFLKMTKQIDLLIEDQLPIQA
jgi:hypothetical protein